jgi:uncharacterized protein YbjQ (UPF0145 family)
MVQTVNVFRNFYVGFKGLVSGELTKYSEIVFHTDTLFFYFCGEFYGGKVRI